MNDGSCNHMTCAVCGCEFCWLCMKEISDLHYLRSVRGPRRSGAPKFCSVKLPVGTHVDMRSATSVCLSFLRVWLHLRKSQRHLKNFLGLVQQQRLAVPHLQCRAHCWLFIHQWVMKMHNSLMKDAAASRCTGLRRSESSVFTVGLQNLSLKFRPTNI